MSVFRSLFALAGIALLVSCSAIQKKEEQKQQTASPPDNPRPEIVSVEEVKIEGDFKTVLVGNEHGTYNLQCVIKGEMDGCMTPTPGKRYMVFNKTTSYKMPGAKEAVTLKFIQDFSAEYRNLENIGLIPAKGEGGPGELGVYVLMNWKAKPPVGK